MFRTEMVAWTKVIAMESETDRLEIYVGKRIR